jgi:hypothetical protein
MKRERTMVQLVLQMALGEYGAAVTQWMLAHQTLLALGLALWFGLIAFAKFQLRQIETRTRQFVVSESRRALVQNPELTAAQLFALLYPRWSDQVTGWAWCVPHRWDLFPVPARLAAIQAKFQFTPELVQTCLRGQTGA